MRGRYQVGAQVESFSVVDGRYVGTRGLDRVVLDLATGLLEVDADGWLLRGGAVGGTASWVRGEDARTAPAVAFTGVSPVFDVHVARLLGLAVGESRRVALVEVLEPVAATRTVRREWRRLPSPDADVERYDVGDPDTGDLVVLHLAGDLLVSREGPLPAHLLDLDTFV